MEPALLLLAIIFPPIAAYLERGASMQFFLNLFLTALFYVPGLIHVCILFVFPKPTPQFSAY
ncbi:MAG: YqaE/Pmp3 family membrane protein [Sumerlaeia bacterium]